MKEEYIDTAVDLIYRSIKFNKKYVRMSTNSRSSVKRYMKMNSYFPYKNEYNLIFDNKEIQTTNTIMKLEELTKDHEFNLLLILSPMDFNKYRIARKVLDKLENHSGLIVINYHYLMLKVLEENEVDTTSWIE